MMGIGEVVDFSYVFHNWLVKDLIGVLIIILLAKVIMRFLFPKWGEKWSKLFSYPKKAEPILQEIKAMLEAREQKPWDHCDVRQCEYIQLIFDQLEHNRDVLKDFGEQCRGNRDICKADLNVILTELRDQQEAFTREVGRELLHAVRNGFAIRRQEKDQE